MFFLAACSAMRTGRTEKTAPESRVPPSALSGSPLGPAREFAGSPNAEIGLSGLFDVHAPAACRIAVLENGDASFAARIQTLRKADTSIRIQALIFTGDESGLYIAELLKEKKAQGLDVRVIVDAMSNPGPQTQWMYFDLKQNGIEVEGYETFYLQWLNELPVTTHEAPGQDDRAKPSATMRKCGSWTAKPTTGSPSPAALNIANEYFRIDPPKPGTLLAGPGCDCRGRGRQGHGGSLRPQFRIFHQGQREPRPPQHQSVLGGHSKNARKNRESSTRGLPPTKGWIDRSGSWPMHSRNMDFRRARCRFFQNRPRFGETYIEQAYLKAIGGAKKEILIANAYFVPSAAFIEAVKAAARRCVKVIILTNSPGTNDLPMLTIVGRDYYDDILRVNDEPDVQSCRRGGVQIWEWQGRRRDAAEQTEGTIHAKYAVFDRSLSIVGSYNMDPRSRSLNSESAIVFENRRLSRQLAEMYFRNDLEFSRQISLEETRDFSDPADAIYQLEKNFGILIEEDL